MRPDREAGEGGRKAPTGNFMKKQKYYRLRCERSCGWWTIAKNKHIFKRCPCKAPLKCEEVWMQPPIHLGDTDPVLKKYRNE